MRGVNKLVIEVRPEDEYYEKALLFIRPDKINDVHLLSVDAERLLTEINSGHSTKNHQRPDPIFLLLAGISAGSAVSWLIMLALGLISPQ